MRRPVRRCLLLSLFLLGIVVLHGPAQQEDVDTDTAILILNIEQAVSIEVRGGPLAITLGPMELRQKQVYIGSLQVDVDSFTDYHVLAYGTVIPEGPDIGAVQMRVEQIIGPFTWIMALDFEPLGPPEAPLELFSGGNNLGIGTTAIVGVQLDLERLAGTPSLSEGSYIFTLSFMVIEG